MLSNCDYKEKDKLVEIFSVELGKITAILKGCKAPTAKLKFAFQPFCFAEFSVIRAGKFYQVIDDIKTNLIANGLGIPVIVISIISLVILVVKIIRRIFK